MLTIVRALIACGLAALGILLGVILSITDGPGAGVAAFLGCHLVGAMIAPTV